MGAGWRKILKKYFLKVLKRQNLQNQRRSEFYTNDKKSKYSSNLKDIFKSEKLFYERLSTNSTTSKAATTTFLSKMFNIQKISNAKFNLSEAKISSDEIIKSRSSQANNKSSGNDGFTVEFYIRFSSELTPVLLEVCNS